jgi:hypothetical protein
MDGNCCLFYGINTDLVLLLFAQGRTFGFKEEKQTRYGRLLAAGLVLKRYNLPPLKENPNVELKTFMFSQYKPELKSICYDSLEKITTFDNSKAPGEKSKEVTSIVPSTIPPVAGIGDKNSFPPVKPASITLVGSDFEEDLKSMDLGVVLEMGKYYRPIVYPREISYYSYMRSEQVSFVQMMHITSMWISDTDTITIHAKNTDAEFFDIMEELFKGSSYRLCIKDGSSTVFMGENKDKDTI